MNLPIREFRAEGFRSLRSFTYPVSDLDVFVGANGVGKTNLYRALELIRSAAANTLGRDLSADGGLASILWAGRRAATESTTLRLSVIVGERGRQDSGIYHYQVRIGIPSDTSGAFKAEPQIKEETLSYLGGRRPVRLIDRNGASVMARNEEGRPAEIGIDLLPSETVLGRLEQPSRYPELDLLRRTLLRWRFYHGLRTDASSPLRHPCAAVATPTLASDGSDLAAVFAPLVHIREDTVELDAAIERAFPGAKLIVPRPDRTASFGMRFPEFPARIFEAAELSDGTLHYLALAGALLGYRLPPFVALNEPEASLHPELMEPLAELIVHAARHTQIWLVTHSERLAEAIGRSGVGNVRRVLRQGGATIIDGLSALGEFGDD